MADIAEQYAKRIEEGLCPTCGIKTHENHNGQLFPLTNLGVLNSRCLKCNPMTQEQKVQQQKRNSSSNIAQMKQQQQKGGGSSGGRGGRDLFELRRPQLNQQNNNNNIQLAPQRNNNAQYRGSMPNFHSLNPGNNPQYNDSSTLGGSRPGGGSAAGNFGVLRNSQSRESFSRESDMQQPGLRNSTSLGNMKFDSRGSMNRGNNSRGSMRASQSVAGMNHHTPQSVLRNQPEQNETFNAIIPFQSRDSMIEPNNVIYEHLNDNNEFQDNDQSNNNERSLVTRETRIERGSMYDNSQALVPVKPQELPRTSAALQSKKADRKFQQGWDLVMGDHFKIINRKLGEELIVESMLDGCLVARGFCLFRGWGNMRQDLAAALGLFTVSGNQGNVNAMAMKGYFYRNGYGTEESDTEAIYYLKSAVSSKHSWAMSLLAYCYQEGEGLKRDTREAVQLYKKSADLGYCKAAFNVAELYAKGQWLEKDYQRSMKWYKRAAEQDYVKAVPAMKALEKKIRKPSRKDKRIFNIKLGRESKGKQRNPPSSRGRNSRISLRSRSKSTDKDNRRSKSRSKSVSSRRSISKRRSSSVEDPARRNSLESQDGNSRSVSRSRKGNRNSRSASVGSRKSLGSRRSTKS